MRTIAFRLRPGEDLLAALVEHAAAAGLRAPVVVTCVGSLSRVVLRMAGASVIASIDGSFEIVSLVGTVAPDGAHLHVSVSDEAGVVTGGHLMPGSIVRTTAEVVVGEVDGAVFRREVDPSTGWDELIVEERTDS